MLENSLKDAFEAKSLLIGILVGQDLQRPHRAVLEPANSINARRTTPANQVLDPILFDFITGCEIFEPTRHSQAGYHCQLPEYPQMAVPTPTTRSERRNVAMLGVGIGLVVALILVGLEVRTNGSGFSVGALVTAHTQNAALWLTDLLPALLGALGWHMTPEPQALPGSRARSLDQVERLFQEYTQANSEIKRQFGGTGLGLAISARLAELMGGRIAVTSELGAGSTFTLRLPMPDTLMDGQLADSERSGGCVLIIDDDPVIANVARVLKREGFSILSATNRDEAFAMASERMVHTILLDIALNSENGWQVLEELHVHDATQGIPVVVASVEDEADRAHEMGAVAFLPKPLSNANLVSAMRRYRAN
jgi:CheY-like chemotaxis protein